MAKLTTPTNLEFLGRPVACTCYSVSLMVDLFWWIKKPDGLDQCPATALSFLLFLAFKIFIILCVCRCSACRGHRRALESLEAGVTGGWEPSNMGTAVESEPSFQPCLWLLEGDLYYLISMTLISKSCDSSEWWLWIRFSVLPIDNSSSMNEWLSLKLPPGLPVRLKMVATP